MTYCRCTECGKREWRDHDTIDGLTMLKCCSTPGCLALPESETEYPEPPILDQLARFASECKPPPQEVTDAINKNFWELF